MSLTPTPVCVQTPRTTFTAFITSYVGGTIQTLLTAGPNGNKIVAITGANNGGAAKVAQVWDQQGGVNQLETSFQLASAAGIDGATPNGNIMSLWSGIPHDNDGQAYFFLEPGHTLGVSLTSTIGPGGTLWITCVNAEF